MSTLELIETDAATSAPPQPAAATVHPLTVSATPSQLLQLAVQQGADLDRLERLMALQERWEANEARKAFVTAMAEFKAEPLVIIKSKGVGYETKEGGFVGYKHATLADVTNVVGPAMARHGLSYRWDIKQEATRIYVSCIVTHKLGHSETVTMDAAPDSSGKKNAIQQSASSVQYLQRYTLLAASGTSTQELDDDGRGGPTQEDADEADMLQRFRDAALQGTAALRKMYEELQPEDGFWSAHSKALKAAAKTADEEGSK